MSTRPCCFAAAAQHFQSPYGRASQLAVHGNWATQLQPCKREAAQGMAGHDVVVCVSTQGINSLPAWENCVQQRLEGPVALCLSRCCCQLTCSCRFVCYCHRLQRFGYLRQGATAIVGPEMMTKRLKRELLCLSVYLLCLSVYLLCLSVYLLAWAVAMTRLQVPP